MLNLKGHDWMKLGKLEVIDPRQVWQHEAYDFTPWLAGNLTVLGESIGSMELELVDTEVSVGPYFADIIAEDSISERLVVIENQLQKTNHDHLGKCLTYAAVLGAKAIIWVATEFSEEHKKALDWLNDHTGEELSFIGLQLEVVRIEGSLPAVQFNVISTPNEVVRSATRHKNSAELTGAKKLQLKFWERFREALNSDSSFAKVQAAAPRYWYNVAIGKSGIHLSNVFNTNDGRTGVRLYVKPAMIEEWMPFFVSKREEIEEQLGARLDWPGESAGKYISLSTEVDPDDESSWQDAIDWLVPTTAKFKDVFSRLIKEK